ncbi:MAG TPA: FHA domain-containing protein [Thermoanaerobaculia bacterium]|jgi:pSer/pThr/pTyr-binding forkhead associated (FHA) protein|nr:FHA domain-containing protein [Thermoanaerobaculia bacterium]
MAADLIRAALLYRSGPHRDFPLPDAPEAMLGFGGGNVVRVPMEGVSRHHAKITFDGKDYWLEDAGSSNGTFVNGVRVRKRERLKHLDVVTLGRATDLIFFLKARDGARATRQGILSAEIEAVDGAEAGTRWPVPRGSITIGRAASNNVVVDSQLISKMHVRIERTGVELVITDLHSHNGTYVDGKKIDEPRVLNGGDEFLLAGARRFRVHVEEGSIETSAVSPLPLQGRSESSLPMDWKTRIEWTPEEIASFERGKKEVRPADAALRAPEVRPAAPAAKAAAPKREPAAPKAAEAKPSATAKPESKPAAAAPAKPAEAKPPAAQVKPAARPAVSPQKSAARAPVAPPARAEASPAAPPKPAAPPPPEAAKPAEPPPAPLPVSPPVAAEPIAPPARAEASPAAPPKPAAPPPEAAKPADPVPPPVAAEPKKVDSRSTLPPPVPPAGASVAPPLRKVRVSGEATKALIQDEATKPRVYLEGETETLPLPAGDHVVGRTSGITIRLDAHEISRRHAVIHVSNAEAVVEDLGSHNGTFVNREKITAPRKLNAGDLIHFGDVAFRVRFPSEAELAKKP